MLTCKWSLTLWGTVAIYLPVPHKCNSVPGATVLPHFLVHFYSLNVSNCFGSKLIRWGPVAAWLPQIVTYCQCYDPVANILPHFCKNAVKPNQTFNFGFVVYKNYLARSAKLPTGLYILPSTISSFYLFVLTMSKAISVSTGPIFTIFHQMEGICMNILDPVHFFLFFKGRCHGNQFCVVLDFFA